MSGRACSSGKKERSLQVDFTPQSTSTQTVQVCRKRTVEMNCQGMAHGQRGGGDCESKMEECPHLVSEGGRLWMMGRAEQKGVVEEVPKERMCPPRSAAGKCAIRRLQEGESE